MTATTTEQPINTRWKECQEAMVQAFGRPRFEVMVQPLIPLRYEGAKLVLGAPSAFLRDYLQRQLLKRVEKILGHPVKVELSDIARKAAAAKRQEGRAG